jgi:hypothetical protein
LNPDIDNLSDPLKDTARFGYADVVRYLLDLGARPNDKNNGGSLALEQSLWHLEFEDRDHLLCKRPISMYRVYRTIETITVLVVCVTQNAH